MGLFDRGCDWYCDNCDAHLNNQSGFTALGGLWTCKECGYINDVSNNNILSGDEEEFVRTTYVVCPRCRAHMTTDDYEHYECPDCNCSGIFDYDNDTLNEN